jgi:Tol biopolymer transport system component
MCVLLVAAACALVSPALAQSPRDVSIDIHSGQTARIKLHIESLAPAGDRTAGTWSVQADEVIAHDLETSAVFSVTRGWTGAAPEPDAQGVVVGKFTVNGTQVRLTGEVRDLPARRPILVKEYRGAVNDWRSLAHRFADDVVLQFTGESGVSQTRIAFVTQEGRNKELMVMDVDGARITPLTHDKSIALSPGWSPRCSSFPSAVIP